MKNKELEKLMAEIQDLIQQCWKKIEKELDRRAEQYKEQQF